MYQSKKIFQWTFLFAIKIVTRSYEMYYCLLWLQCASSYKFTFFFNILNNHSNICNKEISIFSFHSILYHHWIHLINYKFNQRQVLVSLIFLLPRKNIDFCYLNLFQTQYLVKLCLPHKWKLWYYSHYPDLKPNDKSKSVINSAL